MKNVITSISLLLLSSLAAMGSSLAVTSSATPSGSLYNYAYTFTVSGTGSGFDNFFLGSNDLSPLNVAIQLNSAPTTDWSYLGNDTPQNYLQFFSLSGTDIVTGTLKVTFSSVFGPSSTQFAEALNDMTNQVSNVVTGVTAPTTAPTPEPATTGFVMVALVFIGASFGIKRFATGTR
jgi:hypothetical protein